jgi:transcriptional regulator of acetoin/glycerol metabolism
MHAVRPRCRSSGKYLVDALALAGGSISEAARLAGVDRANFRRLLRRHDLGGGKRPSDLDDA